MGECEGMREKCLTLDLCMLIDKGKNHQVEDLVLLDGRSHGVMSPVQTCKKA